MRFYQKVWFKLYYIPLIAALLFISDFWAGLKGILTFVAKSLWFIVLVLIQQLDPQVLKDAVSALLTREVAFFILGGIAYFLLFRVCLFFVAQFALPISEWEDRKKAYERLVLFTRGKHGPAIFVQHGEKIFRQGELDSTNPGVALVDASSAVVLVQHDDVKSISLPSEEEWEASMKQSSAQPAKKKRKSAAYEPKEPEVKGPGVVFTEKGQKIDDVVDLRKQTRTSDFLKVYTRNGIKVKSKVTVVFSLAEPPEKMFVGYMGGKQPTDLKILKVKKTDTETIINGGVELDVDDAIEILRGSLPMFESPPSRPFVPYPVDQDRVRRAVFNQAQDWNKGKLIPWHSAPLEVATDVFRRIMSDVPSNNLFSVSPFFNEDDRKKKAEADKTREQQFLADLKEDFALRVKARGVMAFQFIEHLNGDPFYKGQVVSLDALRQQTPVTLTRNKFNFFRHMGIVVKSASFGDVLAVDEEIHNRMLEAWKAKLEREIAASQAEFELQSIRVRNRNRALVQEEMTHLLSSVFQTTPHFDEALALRVLQALETSVTDHEMSSADLNEALKSIYELILVDQKSEKNNPENLIQNKDAV
jgi:hypothetical protein